MSSSLAVNLFDRRSSGKLSACRKLPKVKKGFVKAIRVPWDLLLILIHPLEDIESQVLNVGIP